ncbi:MAG: hypothetical protein RBU23_08565 [Candidatus Auribacterota bacterium]|nr:hypothetical protein [Candidatus Auribacterota bacterium]
MNRTKLVLTILIIGCCYCRNVSGAPTISATFGADGESGIYFDTSYNVFSNEAQTSTPGINFAGAGGVGVSLAQVFEFDAAVSTSLSYGEGYFITETDYAAITGITVTPMYTDITPAQTGLSYVLQHYTIANLTSSALSSIWFISYVNADLMRASAGTNPPQRVGLLNDEKITLSAVAGSSLQNLSVRQYQNDGTELYAQAVMYHNGLSAVDAYMIAGPGTPSGGADYIYNQIIHTGASNFTDALPFYGSGEPVEYSVQAEYAFALAFDIGTLSPGEAVQIVVALSTEDGNFAEGFFFNEYPSLFIPEPLTIIMLLLSVGAVRLRTLGRHS